MFAFKYELESWLRTSSGMRACGTEAHSPDAQPDWEDTNARNTELLQELEKLFEAEHSAHAKAQCSECGSPMQFLIGQFWIYGSRRKRSLSVPICPACNIGWLQAINRHQRAHIQCTH